MITALLNRLTPRQNLAAGGLTLIASVAAYVYMSWHGDDTTGLVVMTTPVITSFLQHAGLQSITATQSGELTAAVEAIADHPNLKNAVREIVTTEVPALIHRVLDEREGKAVPAQREAVAS